MLKDFFFSCNIQWLTILGSPLPEEEISSTILAKFKLEHRVKKGIFLAPKTYRLVNEDGKQIIKHKGPAKGSVDGRWWLPKTYRFYLQNRKNKFNGCHLLTV